MQRLKFWSLTVTLAIAVGTVLGLVRAQDGPRPVRALLVIGGCFHDYKKQKDILAKGISDRAHVDVTVAFDPSTKCEHLNPVYENPDWAKGFDVVIHDECSADVRDLDIISRILEPHRQGVPAVVLHCGMHSYRSQGFPKMTPWFEFTGIRTTGHGPQKPIEIAYRDKDSPITQPLDVWTTKNEELYNNLPEGVAETVHPVARGKQTIEGKDGKNRVDEFIVAWTNTYKGKTKVFATTLGHNNDTVADARYLDLVTRGLLWSVGKLDSSHLKNAK